jgi:hypothetical protein
MMPFAFDPSAMKKALEVLDVNKRLKANAARLRYENRLLRLSRRKSELESRRAQHALDPIARALAKAITLANSQDT